MTAKYIMWHNEEPDRVLDEHEVHVWRTFANGEDDTETGICLNWDRPEDDGTDHQITLTDEDLEALGYTRKE